MGSTGRCQACKSAHHHAWKRIRNESLIIDRAGDSWWVWTKSGDVLVLGKKTQDDADRDRGGGGGAKASATVHAPDPERPGRTACGHRTSTVRYVADPKHAPACSTCRTIVAQRKRSAGSAGGGGAHLRSTKRIVRFAHDCPHCGAFASECGVEKANGSILCARTGRPIEPRRIVRGR
jgi:hypothetical protein